MNIRLIMKRMGFKKTRSSEMNVDLKIGIYLQGNQFQEGSIPRDSFGVQNYEKDQKEKGRVSSLEIVQVM